MTLYQDKYKIDSKRLKNWDYSSEAIYFITIVTKNRECIFGSIENEKMILNKNGQIVENELFKSIKIRKNWFFHNWVVMPNHVHLLIEIQKHNEISTTMDTVDGNNPHTHIVEAHSSASTPSMSTKIGVNVAETHCCAPLRDNWSQSTNHDHSDFKLLRKPNSISSFVALFKSVTTAQINKICEDKSKSVSTKIWQTNYHDHIVRNYKRFETIYNYIKSNPRSWDTDSINSNFQ
ncbi:transposase [Flavobacterium sp. LC2016-12]|uniref:transposase n=1 Tax=Flavobacterium sp. LC2016-12 TaxID=2783794 RepID=UPI00188C9235|nr:transposase [Flavobacterium sp. LC2016-12]MBF4464389.1 transposase [Flavobacterium sp. LC2016-12]